MTNFNKQIISLIQQAQERQAKVLDLTYNKILQDVKLADLKRAPFHSRTLVESQLKVIIDSLSEYGFLGGIYINAQTNEVIDGWYRSELWSQMGNHTIPAYLLEFQSGKQEREAHLRLNQVMATFTPESFGIDFAQIDLLEFGFTEEEIQNPNQISDQIKKSHSDYTKPQNNDGYKKLTTTLKVDAYLKLHDIKKKLNVTHIAEVVEFLIESYGNR